MENRMKIIVAGMGYVGLSNAVLLAQNNEVYAYDIMKQRVDMVNSHISPIKDRDASPGGSAPPRQFFPPSAVRNRSGAGIGWCRICDYFNTDQLRSREELF